MTSTDYLLPQLPFGSAEYTIVRWLKRTGDAVSAGEPLLVVVNDRVEAALPATCAGILDRLWSADGAAVLGIAVQRQDVAPRPRVVERRLDPRERRVEHGVDAPGQ